MTLTKTSSDKIFTDKQMKFIIESTAKWNLAHGSVRAGKTEGSLFRFLQAADKCPDSNIYMVGHTSETLYRNVVKLIFENPRFSIFRPFCTWSNRRLYYKDKTITVLGAKDEGALGNFQGITMSLVYCDEMALYPDSIIEMIDSRLSLSHSMGIATMNPSYPSHKLKAWIDMAEKEPLKYYALHFFIEDNTFLPKDYIERIKNSLTGVFYKRYYLGQWCLADGAVFDFFDRDVHVVPKPPRAAEYWIASIDYGVKNAFVCLLLGISTGKYEQQGKKVWVEKEYYWDCVKRGRQKTNSEFADDVYNFLEPYAIKSIYIDPSALSMKLELQRRGMHAVEADNDVLNGIQTMTSEMAKGNLVICKECSSTIKEIESYVWDDKKAKLGEDAVVKKADHAIDAMRYAIHTHKVKTYKPPDDWNPDDYRNNRFSVGPRRF